MNTKYEGLTTSTIKPKDAKAQLLAAVPQWITNENREKSIHQFTVIPSTEADQYRRLASVE